MSDSIKSSSVSRHETDGLSKFGLRNFAAISYHVLALSVFSLVLPILLCVLILVSCILATATLSMFIIYSFSYPASILRKSTSGRHRPVSYADGPI